MTTKPRLLLLLLLAGCAGDAAPRAAVESVDSAGVRIVTGNAPARAIRGVDPVLAIGAVEGSARYQLHRVGGVTRLSDGTVVLSDGGTELRWYSPRGAYIRTVGRKGQGPGEFSSIDYLRRLRGDSLLVSDALNRRVSILAPDGSPVRDFTPPVGAAGFPLQVAAALEDGTLLLRERQPIPEQAQQLRRDTLTFSIAGASPRVLGSYAGREAQLSISGEQGRMTSVSIAQLPFSRDVFAAASTGGFIIGSNEHYELHVFGPDGTLQRIVRRSDVTPRPVDDELLAKFIDARIAEIVERGPERPGAPAPDPASIRSSMQALPRVATAPVHGGFLAADDGTLWVKQHTIGAQQSVLWDVYAPDGRLTHAVALPARFRPLLIHEQEVYGVERDEQDVEFVTIYRVQSPDGARVAASTAR